LSGCPLIPKNISAESEDIQIELSGQDGNAFFILGKCLQAMRKAGLPQETRDTFKEEATADNYDHLL
jgi:hypothetical protein